MNWKNILDDSVRSIRSDLPPARMKDRALYGQWLSQTYHFVCHSTSLLGFALPFLHDEKLRGIFEHHLGEESRHDLLALKDIEKLGLEVCGPSPLTEAFYQGQYYRIQFEGAKALLGYILFLEFLAVTWGKELYQELSPVYPKSVLFLKVHAEEDLSHVARARDLIEALPEAEQILVRKSFEASVALYSNMLKNLQNHAQKKAA